MVHRPVQLMTTLQLAEYLHVHPSTIYRLLREGHVPFIKVGGAYRFDRDEIEKWMITRQAKEN